MVAGADIDDSPLGKKYSESVYKHYQRRGTFSRSEENDFYSPCRPEDYIRMRLVPLKLFYQKRLPQVNRRRHFYQALALTMTTAGAGLAYFEFSPYVALTTAIAGAVTSWCEFTDVERKIGRYSTCVRNIKQIEAWWESLGDVDKASVLNIQRLVLGGEKVLLGELGGWQTIPGKDENDAKDEGDQSKK
jgi:hypothetical protein